MNIYRKTGCGLWCFRWHTQEYAAASKTQLQSYRS